MPDINSIKNKYSNLIASIGRSELHSLHPNDFEYYSCSIELTNYADEIVDMLIFPIMPTSIRENFQPIVNIKKSSSAIISLFNPTFNTFPIQINGTFGKKFRFLLGSSTEVLASGFNLFDEQFKTTEFDAQVKTGYGCIKILERILKKSTTIDEKGRPYKLFFYNLAFNSSYLVEATGYSFEQSLKNNMMWDYNVSFEVLAPANSVRKDRKSSLSNLLKYDNLQKLQNAVFDDSLENFFIERNKLIR